jgi:invasion protein IalB
MKLRSSSFVVAAVLSATWYSAALAQQRNVPPADAQATAGKTADLDEVVCEKQEVVGSRLATKRVCMTRGQWADLRSQDRQDTERVQTQRGQVAPQ